MKFFLAFAALVSAGRKGRSMDAIRCSQAAYYELSAANEDYPHEASQSDMCGSEDLVGSQCKCSDPEKF